MVNDMRTIVRVVICFTAAALVTAVVASPAAADGARDALARHAAYAGHPDGVVLTYRTAAAAKASASPGPSDAAGPERDFGPSEQTTYRHGLFYHEIDRGQGVSTESGFDGRAYWASNENRYTVALYEEAQRRAITANAVDAGAFDETTDVQQRGAQTIDGTQYDVVRVTPRGGIAADVAIDRTSGAFGQVTYDPDDRYNRIVVRILGYTEIAPGVRVPTSYRYDRDRTATLLRGAARPPTDAEMQRPAAPTAVWSFGNGAPVRFDIERGTWAGQAVIVHASINGKPGTFLLDSGASQVLLYRPYADALGLTMLGTTTFSGVNGGTRTARFARAESISVGDNTLSNVVLAISPREPGEHGTIDGILGFDLLAGALVHVDLVKEVMEFGDPAQMMATVPKNGYAFSVNLSDGTPEVRIKVGAASTRATFDTGNDFNVVLSENLTKTGRVVGLLFSTIFFAGVDGIANEPASCYKLNEIVIGPFRYQNSLTCFGSERVFGSDGGLIGFDFLRHFDWTFDYSRSRLILAPNGR
jgi:predicted aspartyl protease